MLGADHTRCSGTTPAGAGKTQSKSIANRDSRSTPAGAGKMSRSCATPSPRRAHPRRRGEDATKRMTEECFRVSPPLARGRCSTCAYFCHVEGTPPLVRRRLARVVGAVGNVGLTPAGAGKTWSDRATGSRKPAHPRWRGEDLLGSSLKCLFGGLTPAGAGKTGVDAARYSLVRAHPRWCGEDSSIYVSHCATHGSPPLARGIHLLNRSFMLRYRVLRTTSLAVGVYPIICSADPTFSVYSDANPGHIDCRRSRALRPRPGGRQGAGRHVLRLASGHRNANRDGHRDGHHTGPPRSRGRPARPHPGPVRHDSGVAPARHAPAEARLLPRHPRSRS